MNHKGMYIKCICVYVFFISLKLHALLTTTIEIRDFISTYFKNKNYAVFCAQDNLEGF